MSKVKLTLIISIIILIIAGTAYLLMNKNSNNIATLPVDESEMLDNQEMPNQTNDTAEINPNDVSFVYGKTWVWTKTQMNDDSQTVPNQPGKFTLVFNQDGTINGTTDCNSFFGNVSFDADGFMTFGPIGSTKMFCENSQETEFINMITNSNRVFLTDEGILALLIQYDSGSVLFEAK